VIPFKDLFSFAIDQDGSLYVKFFHPEDADYMVSMHFYFARTMIKFYKLNSVNKKMEYFDKSKLSKICWRISSSDQWQDVDI
jgi:hypothetical protein